MKCPEMPLVSEATFRLNYSAFTLGIEYPAFCFTESNCNVEEVERKRYHHSISGNSRLWLAHEDLSRRGLLGENTWLSFQRVNTSLPSAARAPQSHAVVKRCIVVRVRRGKLPSLLIDSADRPPYMR